MRAILGFFFFGLVALAAGTLGFQAGVASAVAGGPVHPGALLFLMGGPHLGGLFFLFFLFAIVMAIGSARRRYRMHGDWTSGPMGHGPWGGRFGEGDPRRHWMSDMHRQMHEADAASTSGAKSPTGTTGATGATGTADSTSNSAAG